MGGYKVQGKTVDSAQKIIDDGLPCRMLACSLCCLMHSRARKIATSKVDVPVIGTVQVLIVTANASLLRIC